MKTLLEQRLPEHIWAVLQQNPDQLDLLCFAAFGIPRALLNMVRALYTADDETDEPMGLAFSRTNALRAIRSSLEGTMTIFTSLARKLPMYENFIAAGRQILDRCVATVKNYNRDKSPFEQSVTIAIRKPIPPELGKILGFFQYAGLLLPKGEVSRGEKGVFEQFVIHYAQLIDSNALIVKKAVNTSLYVQAFQHRHAKEFTRVSPSALLGKQSLALALPPCQLCGSARVSEAARFCLNCGRPLKSVSLFEAMIENDIAELELTPKRVATIKAHSAIRIVKDILLDHEHRELRRVPRIGPYWAKRIYSYAEEYLA